VQVSARLDYAVRALLELAAVAPERLTRDELAARQSIPAKYLESILASLRHAGLVRSHRGPDGGFALAVPAEQVTVGAVARVVEGPLTLVQGARPESVAHEGGAAHLPSLWVAVRAALRSVLDSVTLADVLSGQLPTAVATLLDESDAWSPR
jgi:Rrf2 family protein